MIPEVTARHSDTEDFARYEFKYVLTEHQRHEIEAEIRHFMAYDGHVHEELETEEQDSGENVEDSFLFGDLTEQLDSLSDD